jgi:hypothetical protein
MTLSWRQNSIRFESLDSLAIESQIFLFEQVDVVVSRRYGWASEQARKRLLWGPSACMPHKSLRIFEACRLSTVTKRRS